MNYATSMSTPRKFSLGGCVRFADLTTFGGNAVSWDCDVCGKDGAEEHQTLTANQLAAEVQHRHGKGRCDK
jgi:hypothetical protein